MYAIIAFVQLSFKVKVDAAEYIIETCSNSTISDLAFVGPTGKISFSVSGAPGTEGFCNITIHAGLMSGDFTFCLDEKFMSEGVDYVEVYNGAYHAFSLSYEHSNHEVEIYSTIAVPDFASWLFLPFGVLATLLVLSTKLFKKAKTPVNSKLKTSHFFL
jgi:hypothetical protein